MWATASGNMMDHSAVRLLPQTRFHNSLSDDTTDRESGPFLPIPKQFSVKQVVVNPPELPRAMWGKRVAL